MPELADIQALSGAEQASSALQPNTPQQPPPSTAVPDSTNPDAPQQPVTDPTTGQPTTYYGKALGLVQSFDQYVKGGGDITKFDQSDFQNLQTAVDSIPGFENQTDSPSVMYARFKEGKEHNIAVDAATKGIPQTALDVAGSPNTWMAVLGAGKDLLYNTTKFVWDKTVGAGVPSLQDIGDMFHGDFSMSHTQDLQARQTNALVETVADKWDQYTVGFPQGLKDFGALYGLASARATAANPDQAAQLDFKQSEIIRGQIARDKQTQANITGARDQVANVYKMIGASDFAQRLMTQQPDASDMYVLGTALDPTTFLAGPAESVIKGAGEKLAATFLKTGFRTAAVEETATALSAVQHQLSDINATRTNLTSILKGDGVRPLDEATRSGWEANLQRLNSAQSKLEADTSAAQAAHQAAIAEMNKQMDQAANASPLRWATGKLTQAVGATGELPGKVSDYVASIPRAVVDKFMPSAPDEVKAIAAEKLKNWGSIALQATGAAVGGHQLGTIEGALGGGLVGRMAGGALDLLEHFSHDIRTVGQQYALGQQTLPFWKGMSEKLTGVSSWLASKMDNPLVYSIPAAGVGGAGGAAIGGGLALIQGGGNTEKFQQGLASGMVIGTAGGGLGQLRRFNSPAELRQAAIGDRSRFLGSLTAPNKELFQALHPEYQLALSTYAMAHPDLVMQFEKKPGGSNGSYTLNPNPIAVINVASDNPLAAVASHEVAHHIAAHGLGSAVDSSIRGNPITGQVGIMSALGPDGKPMTQPVIDRAGNPTGAVEYVPNAQFEAYKTQYNARKLRDNPNSMPEDNYGISQEMFAELHAEHMTNRETMQKMARGYVPSDLVSENVTANWLTKMGMGADPTTGNPIPTGPLEGAKGLQRVIDNYYRQRQYKKLPLETGGDRGGIPVPVGEIVKGTPEFDRIQTNLNASGDLHRNPDGSIAVDLTGRPRVKTERQADADAARMGKTINDMYQAQPGLEGVEGDNYLKLVTDRAGRTSRVGQRMPEPVFGELERSNQYNANQLLNMRKIDGGMQRNDGTMFNTVYNTASKGKGKYATLPARERSFVPIQWDVSLKTNQVNVKAYDPELLQVNLNKRLRNKTGKDLYNGDIGVANADVRTYLKNLANNQPGETGIGLQKKGFINELFGFNADANPYAADIAKRSPDVFKSFRIDRINRVAEISGAAEPFHAQTYEQVRSFMQPRSEPVAAGAPEDNAIPVTERQTKTGKTIPVAIDYGITKTPLVADKQPPEGISRTSKHPNDFSHIDYITAPDQKKLTHLNNQSAVTSYADKLVEEFAQHADNPIITSAKTWYSDVLEHLTNGFGKHAEIFAHLLAATSPGQGVVQNFKDARIAFEQWRKGSYDDAIDEFKKTGKITEEMKPRKPPTADNPAGAKFGKNSDAVLKVLAGTWLDTVEGPKTPNFFDNLFERGTRATIDMWAARTMRRLGNEGVPGAPQQYRIQPKSEVGVSNLDFAFSQEAFDQAAKRLGIKAHELQAIMWYGEKMHWATKGYSKGGASAAMESYVPQLAEYAKQRQAAGLVEQ